MILNLATVSPSTTRISDHQLMSPVDAYNIEIYVSGFAVKQREFGILTRSQKGFMKIAKCESL